MKKIAALLLCMGILFLSGCDINLLGRSTDGTNDPTETRIMNGNGEQVPLSNVEQTAIKNENFLDTEVSWYSGNYNYWVFEIGTLKNVPLTSTYTIFDFDGAKLTYSNEIVKTTIEGMQSATAQAIAKSVKLGGSSSIGSPKPGITTNLGEEINKNLQSGYSMSLTGEISAQSTWSETYVASQSYSESQKSNMTLTFDKTCKTGNYLYLYLGNLTVYCGVVQSRTTGEYFVQIYNKIDAHKYALKYTGEDDTFPINEKSTINIDTSFVANLSTPTNELKGSMPAPDTDENLPIIKDSGYWPQKVTIPNRNILQEFTYYECKLTIEDFDYYYSEGYNKIKISYDYHTTGTSSLWDGIVYIHMCVNSGGIESDMLYKESTNSSEAGRNVANSFTTDLENFRGSKKIHFYFRNKNLTEKYDIKELTITYELYRE